MVNKYTQSIEHYKGFTLEIVMTKLNETMQYHRTCQVSKCENRIAICKTKKEAKQLIDEGCWNG